MVVARFSVAYLATLFGNVLAAQSTATGYFKSGRERSDSVIECLVRDRGFKPHWRQCVVPLSKNITRENNYRRAGPLGADCSGLFICSGFFCQDSLVLALKLTPW